MHHPSAQNSTAIFWLCNIYIFLKLACHDEQNGGQTFELPARIAELWQFKVRKVKKL